MNGIVKIWGTICISVQILGTHASCSPSSTPVYVRAKIFKVVLAEMNLRVTEGY